MFMSWNICEFLDDRNTWLVHYVLASYLIFAAFILDRISARVSMISLLQKINK